MQTWKKECERNRLKAVREMAEILAKMETAGANEMGNFSLGEAQHFHAMTEYMRAFVDKLTVQL